MSMFSETVVDRVRDAMFRETGGSPVSARQRAAMRTALVAEAMRLNPAAGRFAATAQADQVAKRVIGPDGTVKPSDATRKRLKAARKAAKSAKRAARETEIRRQITESLTAAQAPQPPLGTGTATAPGGAVASPARELQELSPDELAATALGNLDGASPFWQPAASSVHTAAGVPEPAKPLEQMDLDEFHAHAANALSAYGRARGFGSPVWQ